jgi:hypothetical protein
MNNPTPEDYDRLERLKKLEKQLENALKNT